MNWKQIVPVALLILSVTSCKKDDSKEPASIAASTTKNVAYGADAQQKIDVYLPAGRTTSATKVMVLIHGGAWTGGDKTELDAFIDTLRKRLPAYAIFNINYRLSANPNNLFPTQENDVKAALDFIYSKASTYLISDKYALVGVSAGAHLAMLQGFKYTSPVRPKAIASFSGPADLSEMYNHPAGENPLLILVVANAIGSTPYSNPALYTSSSPVNFITAGSPATILFQGGTDPLVSASQPLAVQAKLVNNNIPNQYVFYPAEGHIGEWSNAAMSDAFNKLEAFLEANVL